MAKSLVLTDVRDGVTRYRFLETIRQYAAEKLAGAAEADARREHTAYFVQLAELAAAEILGTEQRAWLLRLDDDHGNMREALRWAIEGGEAETALRLCGALGRYWWMRGYLDEGASWAGQALTMGGEASSLARARALNGAGTLARSRGEYDHATALHTEALALARQIDDRMQVASALHFLGSIADARDDFAASERLYEEELALFRSLGDA